MKKLLTTATLILSLTGCATQAEEAPVKGYTQQEAKEAYNKVIKMTAFLNTCHYLYNKTDQHFMKLTVEGYIKKLVVKYEFDDEDITNIMHASEVILDNNTTKFLLKVCDETVYLNSKEGNI